MQGQARETRMLRHEITQSTTSSGGTATWDPGFLGAPPTRGKPKCAFFGGCLVVKFQTGDGLLKHVGTISEMQKSQNVCFFFERDFRQYAPVHWHKFSTLFSKCFNASLLRELSTLGMFRGCKRQVDLYNLSTAGLVQNGWNCWDLIPLGHLLTEPRKNFEHFFPSPVKDAVNNLGKFV